ncbi:MAG: hypothetical protein HIU91_02020 [Acidobacteria bacterium]|nr:hypothetical protein [Acidobacteriota bacterium]
MVNQTGGSLFNAMTSASIADRLSQVASILRSQFVVEYHPPPAPTPSFHRVRVETTDPDIQIRTRSDIWQ